MKIPKVSKSQYKPEVSEISIVKIENFGRASYYERDLREQKEYTKFIKTIESLVRRSVEYKKYIGYLKNGLNIKQCTFLPQINLDEVKGVGLEMHHYPLTLFDIVSIVVNQKLAERSLYLSPFLIANEVMEKHFENKVGIVPLSKTVHELAHSGEIMIPLNLVFGNVRAFLREYQYGLTDEHKGQLRTLIQLTQKMGEGYVPSILDKSVTHLEIAEQDRMRKIVKEEKELA